MCTPAFRVCRNGTILVANRPGGQVMNHRGDANRGTRIADSGSAGRAHDADVADSPLHVVIGRTPEAVRTCVTLRRSNALVTHLQEPTEAELATALAGAVDGMAVLVHDDTQALRYCLAAEHMKPGLRMVVAIFDRTTAGQLVSVVPGCTVTSPADLACPSFLAAALPGGHSEIQRRGRDVVALRPGGGPLEPYRVPRRLRWESLLGKAAGQLRSHDAGSRILLIGIAGILIVLILDTPVQHRELLRATTARAGGQCA